MLAPMLIGCEAEERTGIFENLKREARQFDHMGTVLLILLYGIGKEKH